jgi:hypothetical protein
LVKKIFLPHLSKQEGNPMAEADANTTACGALFIAFGEQYRREVVRAVRSVREVHPDLSCCVISEIEPDDLPSGVKVLVREPEMKYPFRAKPRYLRESPFERTLFLDTDTTIVRPIDGIFRILDRFDIGLSLLPHYRPDLVNYPYLSTANSGVILFQRCRAVTEMFDRWLQLFDELVVISEARASNIPARIYVDPILMQAISDTAEIRLAPLAPALNFVLHMQCITASPIHIIHGRHVDPGGLARAIDQGREAGFNPRVWIPQTQSALPDGSLKRPSIWLHAPFYALHCITSRLWARVSARTSHMS